MKKFIPVEDHSNLFRDPISHGIINTDDTARQAHRKLKAAALEKLVVEAKREERLTKLESKLSDVESLLLNILSKLETLGQTKDGTNDS